VLAFGSPGYGAGMSDKRLTKEELADQNGEALPDREAMSVVEPFSDPDLEFPLDPPKESSEPGLPPPRD
jgi:hypothetical protein